MPSGVPGQAGCIIRTVIFYFMENRLLKGSAGDKASLDQWGADSSTDTTVGWTKNTQKPKNFEKRKKSSKTQKLKNV